MLDFKAIQEKWKKKWAEEKSFEVKAGKGKKFFGTFPYPYMNGFLHLGHLYSVMRLEVFSRYKRMQGHNVLFAQGWHCTGSPIEAAAKRVREKEPKQWESMKKQGFSEEQIKKFGTPKYWTDFFPEKAKEDYTNLGMGVDFRRSFITTDLNPYYDKFVQWQFRKLKGKGYVIKGKHPVVWDPKENCPVGDHDRIEGEGETPQEFLLVKHKFDDGRLLVTATLRPDTILGITNLYVNPKITYKEVEINGEKWVVGEPCIKNLESQGFTPSVVGEVKGEDLVAKKVEVFGGRKVLIFPASFVDPHFGTGLVHSVPSDSADDLIALQDAQKDEAMLTKYGFDKEEVHSIKPIPVLHTKGYGDTPSAKLLEKYGVKSQNEKKKLDQIREELYKLSFYNATFNELYKNVFSKNLSGQPVKEGKEIIKKELVEKNVAHLYYQLTGKVVARSLAECVVKVVEDQWFLNYASSSWKKLAHECLDNMKLFPEKSRQQFSYVLDWLQNWACVREVGLGTKLPWDKKWVIESLSDSTIYMAYYTISHLLQEEDIEQIDDSVFDYIFLEGEKPEKKLKHLEEMKKEFEYWYPMDFRNSGKDLIQNHLAFSIFNHVAIFPKKNWPCSFGVNGWVTVDGQKMSKSLGNFIMLKDLVNDYPVDGSRITILSGGEGLDDPNWDSEFVKATPQKLKGIYDQCIEWYGKGGENPTNADAWMEAILNLLIKEATSYMEETSFRSALQRIYFDLPKSIKAYLRKTNNKPNKKILDQAIHAQILMLAPFTPFLSEELWEKLDGKGLVVDASWPAFEEKKIDEHVIFMDELITETKKDIYSVLKLTGKEQASKITLFVAPSWKYELITLLKEELKKTRNPGEILKKIMSTDLKKHGKEVTKIIPRLVKHPEHIPRLVLSQEKEFEALLQARTSLNWELIAEIEVVQADKSGEKKAQQAMPGKPAILVE